MTNSYETALGLQRYNNRDLSWLSFNQRVLEECLDPQVPVAEKIKFIAIHASNLDEFYRVRVSHLETLDKMDEFNDEELHSYSEILANVRREANRQATYLRSILSTTVIPGLEKHGIILYQNHEDVRDEHLETIHEYSNAQVTSFLQPIWLDKDKVAVK